MSVSQSIEPTFGSLFCGCGGFDLGFSQAGFKCEAAFDIDPVAVGVYQENLGPVAKIQDLTDVGGELDVLRNVDVLLAGPPCQGFSTAGKRKLDDPRNQLLLVAGRIAVEVQPKVLVVENVAGALAGRHREYWDALDELLRSARYRTLELRCDASDYGVPQIRKRTLLLAWKSLKDTTPPIPSIPKKTLKDALVNINGVANHFPKKLNPSGEYARIAQRIGPGQKLCNVRNGKRSIHTWDVPEVFGHVDNVERETLEVILRVRRRQRLRDFGDADPVLASQVSSELGYASQSILEGLVQKRYVRKVGRRYDLTNTFNGKFRRLSWDKPSHTVDTRFTQPRYFLHPQEDRGFTIRESARIQGFPDSFRFHGSETDQIRLIGNAVPPPLAYSIALVVRNSLLGA